MSDVLHYIDCWSGNSSKQWNKIDADGDAVDALFSLGVVILQGKLEVISRNNGPHRTSGWVLSGWCLRLSVHKNQCW